MTKNNLKVVYASSSSVYGHQDKVPILENFPKKPINPYGQTKLDDEILAEKYSKLGTKIIGLRYFNIFGKGQTIEYAGVITKFMHALSSNHAPEIFCDGSQIRDFIFVQDIAKSNLMAMLSNYSSGFLNVGTGKTISIKELAEIMIKLYDVNLHPKFSSALLGDVKQSQADTKKIENETGWKYETELMDGLKKIIY